MAGRLYDWLEAKYEREGVFMDIDNIPLGENFRERIEKSLIDTDIVIAMIGPRWLEIIQSRADKPNDFVRIELEIAHRIGARIVPVLLNDARMPHQHELPESLKAIGLPEINASRLRSGHDFKNDRNKLIRGIERIREIKLRSEERAQRIPEEQAKRGADQMAHQTELEWPQTMGANRINTPLKCYLYVSDSKVDMLYAQIPRNYLDRITNERKIDRKLLALSLKPDTPQQTRFSKLNLVCRYINENFVVGDVDSYSSYFTGAIKLRWGVAEPSHKSFAPFVYFAGRTNRTRFGLVGSPHHVIGSAAELGKFFVSWEPHEMFRRLMEDLDELPGVTEEQHTKEVLQIAGALDRAAALGSEQEVEFLAKRLWLSDCKTRDGKPILLGTPIYVALREF